MMHTIQSGKDPFYCSCFSPNNSNPSYVLGANYFTRKIKNSKKKDWECSI